MSRTRLIPPVLTLIAMFAVAGAVQAQEGGSDASTGGTQLIPADLYISVDGNGFAVPGGQINIVPGKTLPVVSSATAPVPEDTTNLLGCTGIGQGEYTSGIYNMPESFGKFQQDANSLLSKQLLTMNFALPQTAALFDQLNNYGNQRYQTFQQGCSVDLLKQDAKKQYLNACVAKLTPDRVTSIRQVLAGQNPPPKDEMVNAMAYAQAWEVCANQYVSDTVALALRKDTNQAFARQVREVENVTNAIKPLLCTAANTGGTGTADNGCWQTLLLPQVRLCLDDSLGCTDPAGYTILEPMVTMPRLFDTLRYIMDEIVISRYVADLNQQIIKLGLDNTVQRLAAAEASLRLSNATLGRASQAAEGEGDTASPVNGTLFFGYGVNANPPPSVEEFQLSYLNCKDVDPLSPLKEYAKRLNARIQKAGGGADKLKVENINLQQYDKVIEKLDIAEADAAGKEALKSLAVVGLGCTVNQVVPLFDPNLTVSLYAQCLPQDRNAFYAMAGYDVSLAATRDVYRYLNLNLKRAYTRLLTQSAVPISSTAVGTADSPSPTLSPELNARLARVVKEVMIPQVEAQIERLDELNRTRGQFGQRAQQLYTSKVGCMYTQPKDLPFNNGNKE